MMIKLFKNTIIIGALCALMVFTTIGISTGGVSPEEADKLGKTLTGVGAEKAGNADGTIPEFTGEAIPFPTGFQSGSGIYLDPYGSERPLFSIDARNMDKHAEKLTDGTKQLMQKYSTFRIDVYPTHRDVVFPDWVIKNTKQNAVNASTSEGGLSMENARAGYPFPIPKTGYEALFNHMCNYQGKAYDNRNQGFIVDSNGRLLVSASGVYHVETPFYQENPSDFDKPWILRMWWEYFGPPRKAGEKLILNYALDPVNDGDMVWQYLPGQRRSKLAPELAFDTPNSGASGIMNMDDLCMYFGSMERYDMKLIGKQEIYVPYNNYRAAFEAKAADLCRPNHVAPDFTRWEVHRVWVVEGTLKKGKRHSFPKRRFYLDEDSWLVLITEQYDARDVLSRIGWNFMTYCYDDKRIFPLTLAFYDFLANRYYINDLMGEEGYAKATEVYPSSFWTAEALAGSGIR